MIQKIQENRLMAEQTFRSPGFFEREIDATARETTIVGTPAGVVGTAEKGPAFVPGGTNWCLVL